MKNLLVAAIMLFVITSCCEDPTPEELMLGQWQVCKLDSEGDIHYDHAYNFPIFKTYVFFEFYDNFEGEMTLESLSERDNYHRFHYFEFNWQIADYDLLSIDDLEDQIWLDGANTRISFADTLMYWEEYPDLIFIRR